MMTSLTASTSSGGAAAVLRTDLPLPGRRQGKVRDIYTLPAEGGHPPRVVIIATDRISAFDVVLSTPIPGKGKLLTEISTHWFEFSRRQCGIGDHLISTNPADLPALSATQRTDLEGRLMIGRATKVVPIEFVARGYLAGSGWSEYRKTGRVCGVPLPPGLKECSQLPEPIFTPATKAEQGHDENIDFDTACSIVGRHVMDQLRDVTMKLYTTAAEYARTRGIIIADTKFEFGWTLDAHGKPTDELILIDEALTPDSSRFWPADEYQPGRPQNSYDKQFVRDYLESLVKAGAWAKQPPGPPLPQRIIDQTLARYREARDRLFR